MKHYLKRLEESIKSYWDNPALGNYGGETFTFGQIAAQIEKLHLFFKQIGIQKGDKIALCAKNTARWGMSFLAGNTYEAVMVPILADFNPESVKALINHSESVILFTDNELWQKLNISEMPSVKAVISTTDFNLHYGATKEIEQAYNNIEESFAEKYPNGFSKESVNYPDSNDLELAIINYTSGTTSSPKGVMLRYECISANVEFGQSRIPSGPNDKIVSMLPMAHMYGLMFELIYPLCGGSSIYYIGRMPTPAILMGALAEIKPYLLITVPLVMEKIYKNKLQPVLDKPVMKILTTIPGVNQLLFKKIRTTLMGAFGGNIREIFMGGAALNPDVEKWLKRIGIPYTVGYGMTEAAPLMAYEGWQKFVPKSCGKAIDFVKVRIDSDDPYNIVG